MSMACTKIRMQSLPKLLKQEYQILSCQFVLCQFSYASRTLCILLMRGFDALPWICVSFAVLLSVWLTCISFIYQLTFLTHLLSAECYESLHLRT